MRSVGMEWEQPEEVVAPEEEQVELLILPSAEEPSQETTKAAIFPLTAASVDSVEVRVAADFAAAQREEVASLRSAVTSLDRDSLLTSWPGCRPQEGERRSRHKGVACPLCPSRAWYGHWRARLTAHLDRAHRPSRLGVRLRFKQKPPRVSGGLRLAGANFTASGTKQLRLMTVLFDRDRLLRVPGGRYLSRSALILTEGLNGGQQYKDRLVRLVLDHHSLSFRPVSEVMCDESGLMRLGYEFVTKKFCELVLQEYVLSGFAIKEVRSRLVMHLLRAGCAWAEMLPQGKELFWRRLLEQIVCSEGMRLRREHALRECHAHGELEHVSLDGLFRPCRSVVGQADFTESATARSRAAIPDREAIRRIVSVRGRTGAVVCCMATKSESGAEIAQELRQHLPPDCLSAVRTVATDAPSKEVFTELQSVLPKLEFLVLDLVHVCFLFESAQGRKRTRAGQLLRCMQAKWNKVDDTVALAPLGAPVRLGNRGLAWRECIMKRSMCAQEAKSRLDKLDADLPYYSVDDYIGDVAALCATFPVEVSRRPSAKVGPVFMALWRATAPLRLIYTINNQRRLLMLPPSQRSQLASGTAGVEVLNAEINNRFRFHGSFYQSTLVLTVKAFADMKLFVHNTAEYNPTLSQMAHRAVTVHTMSNFHFSEAEWDRVKTTECPLVKRRLLHKRRIKEVMQSLPAGGRQGRGNVLPGVRKRPASSIKRHTFNKRRVPAK